MHWQLKLMPTAPTRKGAFYTSLAFPVGSRQNDTPASVKDLPSIIDKTLFSLKLQT